MLYFLCVNFADVIILNADVTENLCIILYVKILVSDTNMSISIRFQVLFPIRYHNMRFIYRLAMRLSTDRTTCRSTLVIGELYNANLSKCDKNIALFSEKFNIFFILFQYV